jgi:hypothetical protein
MKFSNRKFMAKLNVTASSRSYSENGLPLSTSAVSGVVVHPCVINNKPYIVYPRGLEKESPQLFSNLSSHFQKQGYQLKEDQRRETSAGKHLHKRRKWAQVILFSASLLFESAVNADYEIDLHNPEALANSEVQVQLVSNTSVRQRISEQVSKTGFQFETVVVSDIAKTIFDILSSRYHEKDGDPAYIRNDLKKMANYYSQYPETVNLLYELKDKEWEIAFDENNWMTIAKGNMLEVTSAMVYFNTRLAAQLKLNNRCDENPVCIASPADAFLHELLHVHSMLLKSDKFLKLGGMNKILYPYRHEYSVIDTERTLYTAMSDQDNLKRPQRRDHSGRNVKASCPTCIK